MRLQKFGQDLSAAILLVIVCLQAITTSESFSIQGSPRSRLFHHKQASFPSPLTFTLPTTSQSLSPSETFRRHQRQSHPLFAVDDDDTDGEGEDITPSTLPTYGGLLGKITGVSMTAIRKSIRTTTGLSLTATRTALRTLTGVSVTATMKNLFGIFPPWFRYFLQPLFIVYYTPLMILKYFIGSTKTAKREAFAAHEKIVEGWKDAIRAAEVAQEFWPLHVTGEIITDCC